MDFTISEEILKIAFPALCGIGGVVVGAVLKSWFDWKLESKKAEQQRKLYLYENRREAAQEIFSVVLECLHICIILKNTEICPEKEKQLSLLNDVTNKTVTCIQNNSLYLPSNIKHLCSSYYQEVQCKGLLSCSGIEVKKSLLKIADINIDEELSKINIAEMRKKLFEIEKALSILIGWEEKDL